ncbi:G protein coupled receptor [Rhizoctonia solani]|uniref:G protein coupled receptor n=1 Tax=Rhizoctonia solani TaxID=456999 RepID=A0A8H8P5T4_9AGAM|nr:G protein coupled receptor [Rhizoctonia solani]QRW25233.1 G protein coupled receptor [Rhizoctonia solani]
MGTVVLGTLSGFGAITTAWMFADALGSLSRDEVTKQDITSAEHSLTRVRNDLDLRNREALALELQNTKNPLLNLDSILIPVFVATAFVGLALSRSLQWGEWWVSVFHNLTKLGDPLISNNVNTEATALRREIAGLRALEAEMSRELEHMRARQARMEFSKTLSGRIWNAGGWLFGAYCAFRVVNSATNLLFLFLGLRQYPTSMPADTCAPSSATPCTGISTAPPDLISGALGLLVSLVPGIPLERSEADRAARQISLLLVGCIVLSSIRVVLIGVGKILRVTSQSILTSLALLILAQLMGTYLLSTLIQLRTSFPSSTNLDGNDTALSLFSTLPAFEVFGWIFDATFLISACLTMTWRWLEVRLQGM